MRRIFVTGGTGFVGKSVIRALLAHSLQVRCLVRPGSEADLRGFESIDRVPGDVLEPRALAECIEGCSAIIHLVGIIREHRVRGVTFDRLHTQATANMLAVAREAGVKRFLHMSALGTRPGAVSRYHRTKWEAEEAVRASELDWTIFRPSVIYGPGDEFISVLAGMVRRFPAVPVLGDGRYRLQPVAVEHVAEGFARALSLHGSVGQTYEVAGPAPIAFDGLLDQIGQALGKSRVRKLHAPMSVVKGATRWLGWLPGYPVTLDQLQMLAEESVADATAFYTSMGLRPESLAEGLRRLLAAPR
jgi:NADH dehydrogenase